MSGGEQTCILVLGVGNILLRDEGVGVRVVEALQSRFEFSPHVELVDGGTLGLRLLEPVQRATSLIVVDAIRNGGPPGTIYRLSTQELRGSVRAKESLHQLDLLDTLGYAELLGNIPETVVLGIEPEDISPWGTELTETVRSRLEDLIRMVLDEIELRTQEARTEHEQEHS
jgi:hydrogenase maturation protease